MERKNSKQIRAMTECSIMIALSTVLSIIKIIDMPYGGSVTVASMLPIIIAVYRHGWAWGLGAALVNSAIQLLLGLGTLSYFTTWQSIVAIILLDYIVAFGVFALASVFKKIEKRQSYALLYGTLLCSFLRYTCHVISGATVWAGLSIPTEAALLYSLSYNATYMIPETIVLTAVTVYVTSIIDFSSKAPTRVKNSALSKSEAYATVGAGLLALLSVILIVVELFPHLQDSESGEFVFTNIGEANIVYISIIGSVGLIGVALLIAYSIIKKKRAI